MSIYNKERENTMISNNVYMKFNTMNHRDEILSFIKEEEEIKSNSDHWKTDVLKMIKYKDKHLRRFSKDNTYRNIYGYYIKIAISKEHRSDVADYVKKYMLNIDRRYLKILYIYKLSKEGKGLYAEIIAFTRIAYKKAKRCRKVLHRDYYYNSETKKICKSNHPLAVLKAKKGDTVVDKNGNAVYELQEVSITEARIFVYKNIKQLTKRLKEAVIKTINELSQVPFRCQIISRITIDDEDGESIKNIKRKRNIQIRKINSIIHRFCNSMFKGKLVDSHEIDSITETFVKVADDMVHNKNESTEEVEKYLVSWWNQTFVL